MNKTNGIFFDGISSVPKNVELILDEQQAELEVITNENETQKWSIEEISFEHLGSALEIRFPNSRVAFLKVTDLEFITDFIFFLDNKGQVGWYYKLLHLSLKTYVAMAIFILGLIIGGYLIVIPWIAEKAVLIIPEKYDKNLANTFLTDFLTENNVDSAKTIALNNFARQLKLNNTRPIHFTVINSNTVNAFALPDGNIIVFTGLIDLMKNYDELAGLIGHEVIHVNNRHSMKMLFRNLAGYIFISAVLSDVNGMMAVIGENAHNFQSLSYSRTFEEQADEQGTLLLIQNHINPKGMTNLFLRLQNDEKVKIPAFVSSHPLTVERISDINKLIQHTSYKVIQQPLLDKFFREIKRN